MKFKCKVPPLPTRAARVLSPVLLAALACAALSGCMSSATPILSESADVSVPDLSGTYVSGDLGRSIVVEKKANNAFSLRLAGYDEPDEALLFPLEREGAYLMQLGNGEDYSLAVLLVDGDSVKTTTFAAVSRQVMIEAFGEKDPLRAQAAEAMMKTLSRKLKKHKIDLGEEQELLNEPSAGELIAFYNECLSSKGMLEEVETFSKLPPPGAGEEAGE